MRFMLSLNPFFLLALGEGSSRFFDGITVAIIGITVVFLVLGILSITIYFIGVIVNRMALRLERKTIKEKKIKISEVEAVKAEEEEVVAAIGAAIAAYMLLKERGIMPRVPEKPMAGSLWNIALKLEAHNPKYSITRMNVDEVLIEEGIRRNTL